MLLLAGGAPPSGGVTGVVVSALDLTGDGESRAGHGLTLAGGTLRASDAEGLSHALRALTGLGLRVRLADTHARWVTADNLDEVARRGGAGPARFTSDIEGIEVTIEVLSERHIRQVMRLGNTCIEILDATPEAMTRARRPTPNVGSPGLQSVLYAHGLALPPSPLPDHVPTTLRGPLVEVARLGRVLVWRPAGASFAFGLFQPSEMIAPMRACIVRGNDSPTEGAPPLVAERWPFYRWGPLHLAHVGWSPDFTSYYLDQEGCVWSYDPTQDEIEFRAGSYVSFAERLAGGADDEEERNSCLIFFPMLTPGELPSAFGASVLPRRSTRRYAEWVSDVYTFSESTPTLGAPLVEVQARSDEDLAEILRWARRHWGTRKVALIWMPAAAVLERVAREEGITIVDGGPSSWKPASFWEDEVAP